MKFEEISSEEFEIFANKYSKNFMQTKAFGVLLLSLTKPRKVYYVGLKKEGQLCCAALLSSVKILGGYRYELNFGPIFCNSQDSEVLFISLIKNIKKFVKNKSGLILEVSPNFDLQILDDNFKILDKISYKSLEKVMNNLNFFYEENLPGYENQKNVASWQYTKDLSSLSEQNLVDSYTNNGRYFVKKAKNYGIQIRSLEFNELEKFKDLTSSSAKLHSFKDKDLTYYQNLYSAFGDKVEFLVAEIDIREYEESLMLQMKELKSKIDTNNLSKRKKK